MIEEYKTKTNLGVGLGLVLEITARVMAMRGAEPMLAVSAFMGGAILLIWGLCMYAKGKGYSAGWGFLGLLSILGLIILVCMKDKSEESVQRRGFPVVPPRR